VRYYVQLTYKSIFAIRHVFNSCSSFIKHWSHLLETLQFSDPTERRRL